MYLQVRLRRYINYIWNYPEFSLVVWKDMVSFTCKYDCEINMQISQCKLIQMVKF